ncbi:MAG: EamA family transporter RarD [Pseudomonadota bacterium]|nr:EamA family transporter RarD [Pseudomonadota bacterium]
MSNVPSPRPTRSEPLLGAFYALLAYLTWGLMPIYWKAVSEVPPLEMVAHRVVWSVLVLAVLLSVFRRWPEFLATLRDRRRMLLLAGTAVLITGNWLGFIWAVQHDRVMEASLGYYINPLLNVVLGVAVLGERLRPWQTVAVAVAALGVLNMILQLGVVPWIALGLALTFGVYGLLRKTAPVDGLVGLAVETLLLAPLALGFLIHAGWQGTGRFLASGWQTDLLIIQAGLITALPLLWFANAARRLRYSTLGFIQYLAPSVQLWLAVAVYQEPFTLTHLLTFGCIWLALVVYTADASLALRRHRTAPPVRTGRR